MRVGVVVGLVSTGEVAGMLDVEPPNATDMLGRLDDDGYLEQHYHRGGPLTPRGTTLARSLSRRQCVVEDFLLDAGAPISPERALAVGAHLPERAVDRLAAACDRDCPDRCRAGGDWFDGCAKLEASETA